VNAVREDADVETSSDAYARRFAGPLGAFFLEVQERATLDLLHPWPGGTVLDVGGGHAQLTGPLVRAGCHVTVYASHPRCRERVREWTATGRTRFVAGDLLAAPFPDRAFDVVVAYRLLAHVRRWRALVGELTRLARAAVVVDYPTERSVNAVAGLLFPVKRGVESNTRPFAVFGDAEMEGAFAERGFSPTGRRPQFAWPMALHRAHGSARLARLLETGAGALGLRRFFGSPVILRLERRG
jgi:2-polyprenyl-3-methyl-5-hydroxy-6-metoxy-1,4-benzoquinol methylase